MLTVTLTGADGLAGRLERLSASVLSAAAAKSVGLADQLASRAHEKLTGGVLQSRSGALAASLTVDTPTVAGDRLVTSVSAGGDLKYAAIQEYGGATSPHDILPGRAKALAFLAGGEQVFARVVHHPGSHLPERSYLRASLAEMAALIESEMKTAALGAAARALGG